MAIPPTAGTFSGVLDPHEILDFVMDCSGILEEGEQIEPGYMLTVLPEATALGLTIMAGGGRDHSRIDANRSIRAWFEIHDDFKTDEAFEGAGTALPLELTFSTSADPDRRRQRTFLVAVAQQ